MALCQPGDTVLGMSLAHGGHLTHGAKPNFSGKIYHAVQYGLDPATGEIDYDEVERLAREHKPKMIVAGFRPIHVLSTGASATSPTRLAPTCWSTWRISPDWSRGSIRIGADRRCHHDHHAQDLARPACRPDPGQGKRRD